MFPTLQIGPLAIQTPGLILLLGVWLGLTASERSAPRFGVSANHMDNLVLLALVAGALGARLAYVFRYPQVFLDNPVSLVSLNPQLLDLWGGVAAGLLVALAYGQRRAMPFWPTLDALTPGLAILGLAFGFSHLASGAAFGAPSTVPWAIRLWGAERHPSQVYEILAAALILWAVWPGAGLIDRLRKDRPPLLPGVRFLAFVALSAGARLFLEAFRGDSQVWAGGLRAAQIAAWLVLAAGLWAISRRRSRQADSSDEIST